MIFYSIVKSFLMPPGIIILMLIAAFWLARGVMARLTIFTALTLLALMSLPAVAMVLMQPLEIYPAIGTEQTPVPHTARAIVILGAGYRKNAPEYGGETLDDASLRRVRYGAFLQRNTGLPIYVTGGRMPGERGTLAQLMADVLTRDYQGEVAGVESESRTTWENAAFTAKLLERDRISSILLVSDAWHLPRAVQAFRRTGIAVTPAPTAFVNYPGWAGELTYRDWLPSARALQGSSYAIHEHLGGLWYQIRDWFQEAPEPAAPGSSAWKSEGGQFAMSVVSPSK